MRLCMSFPTRTSAVLVSLPAIRRTGKPSPYVEIYSQSVTHATASGALAVGFKDSPFTTLGQPAAHLTGFPVRPTPGMLNV